MKGIAEMFAELDGYDRYQESLEVFTTQKRARAVAATAEWRKRNPEKARKNLRASHKRWTQRYPEKAKAGKKRRAKVWRDRNREKVRAAWRKSSAAYRARKAKNQIS